MAFAKHPLWPYASVGERLWLILAKLDLTGLLKFAKTPGRAVLASRTVPSGALTRSVNGALWWLLRLFGFSVARLEFNWDVPGRSRVDFNPEAGYPRSRRAASS